MPVHRYTATPEDTSPGEITGHPITHLPWVFFCSQGERWCGWSQVASTRKDTLEAMAARRRHEQLCQGGLIVVHAG